MTKFGYLTSGKRDGYHSNENCPNLPENPIKKSMEHIETMELSECKVCSGEIDRSHSGKNFAAQIRGLANGSD